MGRNVLALIVLCAAIVVGAASSASANVFAPTPLSIASAPSPFAPGCEGVPQSGTLYQNAEVEPRVAVDPNDASHIVGTFQQDRWSNGGAHALMAARSTDGGQNWDSQTVLPFNMCSTAAGALSTLSWVNEYG